MRVPLTALFVIAVAVVSQSGGSLSAQGRRGAALGQIPPAAVSEVKGRLVGRITDSSGTPLPGITLTITSAALAEPRMATTDGDGRFEAAGLPPGQFSVTCNASGFVQWRREGVEVKVADATTLNVVMRRPGEVAAAPAPSGAPIIVPRAGGAAPPKPVEAPPPPPPPPAPDTTSSEHGAAAAPPPEVAEAPGPGPAAPVDAGPQAPAPDVSAGETAPPAAHQLLDEIDRFMQQLDPGHIVFNAPEQMRAGDTTEMRLVLSPQLPVAALEKELEGLPGTVHGATIKIAPRMEARLTGPDFTITAITPEQQAVAREDPTVWRWDVTARSGGAHRLHLALDVIIDGTSRTLRTFDQTILVNVTWTQQLSEFAGGNWQWLWAVVVAPLAGWIWRRRRGRTSTPDAPART